MTGMGEDVYTDRSTALDALTEESQRMGMYETQDGVSRLIMSAARAMFDLREDEGADWSDSWCQESHIADARAALESLGIPLSVLAAIRAGTWRAVPVEPSLAQCEAGYQVSAIAGASYHAIVLASPKTPEAAR